MRNGKNGQNNLLIVQCGGPTAVINSSLVGVVEGFKKSDAFDRVLGAEHGLEGLSEGRIVDLGVLYPSELEDIARRPGAYLGTSRDKITEENLPLIHSVLTNKGIGHIMPIGGDGTAKRARDLSAYLLNRQYHHKIGLVTKTIDNDVLEADHCNGYGSAASVAISNAIGNMLDAKSFRRGVLVSIVMGRAAGWIAAAAQAAKEFTQGYGPDAFFCPEQGDFNEELFLDIVEENYHRNGYSYIDVAEGCSNDNIISDKDMKTKEYKDRGERAFSEKRLLADHLQIIIAKKLRPSRLHVEAWATMQRSNPSIVSYVDRQEARELGSYAVDAMLNSNLPVGGAVIKAERNGVYSVRYDYVPIEPLCAGKRLLPSDFFDNYRVTEKFLDYLRPLVRFPEGFEPRN